MNAKIEDFMTVRDMKIEIKTKYNAEFVKEIRLIPGRRWDGAVWTVYNTDKNRAEVERLIRKYFIDRETRVVKICSKASSKAPQVAGIALIHFRRGWARAYDRDDGIKVEVMYADLRGGGSRRHPIWRGTAIMRISAHRGFVVEHDSNTIVEDVLVGEDANDIEKIKKVIEIVENDKSNFQNAAIL